MNGNARHRSMKARGRALAVFSLLAGVAAVVVAVAAFTVDPLQHWRPVTLAGLGVGVFGLSIFLWQRSAARRGARGAQTGLE